MKNEDITNNRTGSSLIDRKVLTDFAIDDNSAEDIRMFVRCLELVRKNLRIRLSTLRQALNEKNNEELKNVAHQLKGSFLMAGAPGLAAHCESLCESAKSDDHARSEELVLLLEALSPQFEDEIMSLTEELDRQIAD